MRLENGYTMPDSRVRLFAFLPDLDDFYDQHPEANDAENDLEHFFHPPLADTRHGDRICHARDGLCDLHISR